MTSVHEENTAGRQVRRATVRRLFAALILALLTSFGVAAFEDRGCVARGCATCCRLNAAGAEHGECIRQCLVGEGLCGALVAPSCAIEE